MEPDRTKVHRAPHKQVFEPTVVRGILERVASSLNAEPKNRL